MNNDFSWSAAREARIDRAIDRAVRDLMQLDPPPGLRRRVLAQLSGPDEARHAFSFIRPQLALAVVALMVVLISATRVWYGAQAPAPPHAPAVAVGAPVPMIEVESVVQQAASRGETSGQITRERIPMPRVANVFGDRPGRVSAATVDGARQNIVMPQLKIVPLSGRPIMIEPLVLPSKGGQ
jgi:hypothetical protein